MATTIISATEGDETAKQRKMKRVRVVPAAERARSGPLARGPAASLHQAPRPRTLLTAVESAQERSLNVGPAGTGPHLEDNIAEESSDVITRTRFQPVSSGGQAGGRTPRLKQRMSHSSSLVSSSTEQSAVVRLEPALSGLSATSPLPSLSRLRRPSRTMASNLTTAFSVGSVLQQGTIHPRSCANNVYTK